LCKAAEKNIDKNGIKNARVIACDSRSFAERILRRRSYRFSDGLNICFNAILVDPPRCGVDEVTLDLMTGFEDIVYVSCCLTSLMRDLTVVSFISVRFVLPNSINTLPFSLI
jgi:tRNA (uracil-5-)-methyltransferase